MKYTSNVTMFGWSRDAVNCHCRSTSSAVWPVIHILLRACRIKRSLPSVRPSSMTVRNTSRFQNISFRFQLKFSSLIRYSGWSQIVHVTYAACHLFFSADYNCRYAVLRWTKRRSRSRRSGLSGCHTASNLSPHSFMKATRDIDITIPSRLSVHLSVRLSVIFRYSKRLNVSSKFFHYR